MANNREALALELKQIIQADRMASDIVDDARHTRKRIEQATEKEKADILAAAQRSIEEMEAQVQAEHEQQLRDHRAALDEQMTAEREKLEDTVRQKRAGWVDDIVARITQTG